MENILHPQSDIALCSLYPSWAPPSQVTTQAVWGQSNPAGCKISHTALMAQQTGSSQRSTFASTRTQPVFLYRRISNRMGGQLAELSSIRTMVTPRILSTHQLAGARNVTADALFRINSPSPREWRIPRETLHNLFSVLGTTLVDMFATAENKVTPVYVSPYPDDRAWAVDALSISWDGLGLVYAFPPAPIVPHTLQKIRDYQGTMVILVSSQHPSRPWYPLPLQFSLHPPILLTDVALFQYIPNIRRPQFHRDP